MQIKVIKTKADYLATMKKIESLMGAKKNTPQGDLLDVLVTLVEVYEEKNFPIDNPDPVKAIEHVMEARGLERRDLESILGSKSRVSEIMGKKRKLTLDMVRKLHHKLNIPAPMLIQDYRLRA